MQYSPPPLDQLWVKATAHWWVCTGDGESAFSATYLSTEVQRTGFGNSHHRRICLRVL